MALVPMYPRCNPWINLICFVPTLLLSIGFWVVSRRTWIWSHPFPPAKVLSHPGLPYVNKWHHHLPVTKTRNLGAVVDFPFPSLHICLSANPVDSLPNLSLESSLFSLSPHQLSPRHSPCPIEPCYSQRGLGSSSICITLDLIRNTNSQALPQT